MTEPFVSVVTPVYNDEPYLEECIRSVLSQSHQDFEYIICNNHSKDRSGEIAADYAAKDSRIRVVSPPEFSPQAKNFNFALREISGRSKYCKMLLSDDWMYPQCLQQMIDVAESNPRIALVSAYRLIERPARLLRSAGGALLVSRDGAVPMAAARNRLSLREPVHRHVQRPGRSQPGARRSSRRIDSSWTWTSPSGSSGMRDFGFVHQVLTFSRYQPETVTDTASHFNWWPLLHYLMMEQYGRDFLTGAGVRGALRRGDDGDVQGLGEQWLKDRFRFRKKKGFWEFQRQHLGDIGVELRPALLARGVVAAGLSLLGSPSTFIKKVRNEMTEPV